MLNPKEIIVHVRRDFKRHSDIKWYYFAIPFFMAAFVLWCVDELDKGLFIGVVMFSGLKGLIITSLIIAAFSWLFNLGGRFEGSFRDHLVSFYKDDNPDWEKKVVEEAGEKMASKYYDVFTRIQIRAVLGMVVLSFLQLLLFKPFVLLLSLTAVVSDFLFLSLVFANMWLYYFLKKAVAHVVYCAETGRDLEDDSIEKQESTGSYQK